MVPAHARRLRRLARSAAPSVPGKVIGPSFAADEVADAIEAVIDTYRARAPPPASASSTRVRRLGIDAVPAPPPTRCAAATAATHDRLIARSQTMKFIDSDHDRWHAAGGEDGPPPTHRRRRRTCCSTLEQWHAVRDHWPHGLRSGRRGCPTTSTSRRSRADLPRLALVALQFPKWIDGRAYSQARLLRVALRFGGEVRATGEVLVDMLPLLQRTGFDAVQLRADQSLEAGRARAALLRRPLPGRRARQPAPVRAEPPGTSRRAAPRRAARSSSSAGAVDMNAVELYARAERRLRRPRGARRRGAAHRPPPSMPARIVQATSLGAEDMVLTDLIARHQLPHRHRHARHRHAARARRWR